MKNENCPDPQPVGVCAVCGERIFPGDPCRVTQWGDLLHDGGILYEYVEKNRPEDHLFLSCTAAYMRDVFSEDDLAAALGVERKQ